jgi:hypothetical protein
MNRRNQILSAVLAVQLVLAAVVFWPRSTAAGAEAGPLLGNFSPGDVVSVTIKDAQGNHITLAKDSGSWVLPEADNFPANGEKVSSLLDNIGNLQTNRLVTRTQSSQKRLQVADDDFVRLVDLKLADGQTHKVYLGSSPSSGATHVRADNQSETYLTADVRTYDVGATSATWIDTQYYTVPTTTTLSVSLKNANGEFEFDQTSEGTWALKGLAGDEQFNQSTFDTLLAQATSLRMVEPIGKQEQPSFGLDKPQALVTLKAQDGKTYTLTIGAKGEDNNNYVAKWSESPYYVRVAQYTAETFVNKTRDDFIEPPATATPQPGAAIPEMPASGGN